MTCKVEIFLAIKDINGTVLNKRTRRTAYEKWNN